VGEERLREGWGQTGHLGERRSPKSAPLAASQRSESIADGAGDMAGAEAHHGSDLGLGEAENAGAVESRSLELRQQARGSSGMLRRRLRGVEVVEGRGLVAELDGIVAGDRAAGDGSGSLPPRSWPGVLREGAASGHRLRLPTTENTSL
jgi:hypothetical protein